MSDDPTTPPRRRPGRTPAAIQRSNVSTWAPYDLHTRLRQLAQKRRESLSAVAARILASTRLENSLFGGN